MARPSSQLGGVNPRIVRDAQSQSAVKQQDLTIDKAEDQLRGTTGRRPDCHCSSPALWICVCRIWEYLMLLFRQRVLAHSLFPSLYPFLSYLIYSWEHTSLGAPHCLHSSVAQRIYRGQSYISRVLHYPPVNRLSSRQMMMLDAVRRRTEILLSLRR